MERAPLGFRVIVIAVLSGLLYVVMKGALPDLCSGVDPNRSGLVHRVITYELALAGVFGLYLLLLRLCAENRHLSRPALLAAVGSPLVFNVLFLVDPPRFSTDVLSYLAHGYITEQGGNPYLQPEAAVVGTPIGAHLTAYRWQPGTAVSAYGPLWVVIQAAVVAVVHDVPTQVLAVKVIAMASSAASAALIWLILAQVRPERSVLGTVAFLWNPVVIIQFAGEGHNDSVMNLFVLLAISLALRDRHAAAMVALCAGVLTKYLPLLFLPVLALWSWRTGRSFRATATQLVAGGSTAMLLAVVAFRPWWAGWRTFSGIRLTGRIAQTGSTPSVIWEAITRIAKAPASPWMVTVMSATVLVVVILVAALSQPDAQALLRRCAAVAVSYLVFVSPDYWPWYASLPLALLVTVPQYPFLVLAVALSFGSSLVAPFDLLFDQGAISRFWFLLGTWTIGIGAPVAVTVAAIVTGKAVARLK